MTYPQKPQLYRRGEMKRLTVAEAIDYLKAYCFVGSVEEGWLWIGNPLNDYQKRVLPISSGTVSKRDLDKWLGV